MKSGRLKSIGAGMQRSAGFTLIELMVAIVLFMIFMGAVFAIYSAAQRAIALAEDQQEVSQTGRVLLGQLTTEVACAYQSMTATASTLDGEDATDANSNLPTDTLTLLTTAHPAPTGQTAGDLCQVSYQIAGDGTTDSPTGLYVTEDFYPGLDMPDETLTPRLISPRVIGLNCRYLTADGTWQEDWSAQTTLPAAVRIELTLQPRSAGAQPIVMAATADVQMATAAPVTTITTATGGANASP